MPRRRSRQMTRRAPKKYGVGQYIEPFISRTPLGWLYKTVKRLNLFNNAELKWFDRAQDAAVANTGTVTYMSTITQGDGRTERTGVSVKVIKQYATVTMTQHASALETFVRVMFIIDKIPKQALPAVTDILQDADVNSFINIDAAPRFRILYDKVSSLSSSGSTAKVLKFYSPKVFHLRYDAAGGAVADAVLNPMFMLVISNEATNTPTVNVQHRMRYVDN